MNNAATQINRLAEAGTGFGDQGMIMLFNKVLDPPSVVRESEAKMTADNQGVVAKGRTLLANLKAGERLDGTARQELLDAVNIMTELANDNIESEKSRIMESVEHYGFGEDRIFLKEVEKRITIPKVTTATVPSIPSGPLTDTDGGREL